MCIRDSSYRDAKVFIWDNDGGATLNNPDDYAEEIGCEYHWTTTLKALGIAFDVSTALPLDFYKHYNILIVINGWTREPTMGTEEINAIETFLDSYNGRVYLEGNSFAEVYSEADPRFLSYFGTVLQDTGDTETDQDTIVGGHTGLFAKIEMPYYTEGKLRGPDTSCDLLAPDPEATGDVDLIIYFPEDTLKRKWYYSRGTAYGTPLIKDGKQAYNYKTILSSLVFSATEGKDNRRLYLRRVLTFFGFSQTLVVDDDEGEASEEVICRDLEMLGVPYVLHKVNPGEDYPYPVDTLLNYDVVIWTNGKANTSTLLTSFDRSILYDYIMKYGGFVMLTGPYTPEFLAKEDPTFLNSVLASDFVDIVGSITFLGEKGSYAEGMKLSLVSGSSSTLLLPIPRNGGDSLFYHADYESYKAVTFVEDRLGKTTLMGFDYADIDNTKSTSTGTIDTAVSYTHLTLPTKA